jgi:hypothetical protein
VFHGNARTGRDLNRSTINVASRLIIANIALDDALILPHPANRKELERRGHRFVRYADDCKL